MAAACDSLLTKPSLYGTVDVQVRRRNGDVIPGAQIELYRSDRPMAYATGPVSEVAIAVIGFSHGRPPAAAASIRTAKTKAQAIKAPRLGPRVDFRMIVIFKSTSITLQSTHARPDNSRWSIRLRATLP